MLLNDVKKLTPLERLVYWVRERESIRLKKEAGEPKPFTDDTILQTYRFCNVRRMDDAVSKWLLSNWYTPYFDHPNMLAAVALARFFNLPSTLERITFPVFGCYAPSIPQYNPELMKNVLSTLKSRGDTIFNGAYMVSGGSGADKIESVVDYYVQPLVDDPPKIDPKSMRKTWEVIVSRYGFGSFMAGQVVADLRWAMGGSWSDKKKWAPAGPGSMRGINRILGRPLDKTYSPTEWLRVFVPYMGDVRARIPESISSRLEAHDLQSILCETDKMNRILNGEGTPKQRYKGT